MGNERARLQESIDDGCNSLNMCQPCMNCKEDKKRIVALMDEGHTYHCACRLTWGDGKCECGKQGIAPGPVSQVILSASLNPTKAEQTR